MDITQFHDLVDAIIERLHTRAGQEPTFFTNCRNGDDFELCVVAVTTDVLQEQGTDVTVHHTPGSHAFPDIVIESSTGEKYGIEVKSSKSTSAGNWTINGNSVVGSTSDHDVIETYIVFGKIAPDILEFRSKRYQDSISKVVVTHSPRYFIDMNVSEEETFFAKSGIEYETIVNSDNPIPLITNYYRSEGMQAWWLSESTPAALRLFSELAQDEQARLIGYGFAHYPELFSSSRSKYKRFALWLATEESVIAPCLRDDFSASGKVSITIEGNPYLEIPQIFRRLMLNREYILAALDEASPDKLADDWGVTPPDDSLYDKIEKWISIVSNRISRYKYLSADINVPQMVRHMLFDEEE